MLSQLSTRLANHGASIAPERALGTLVKLIQREANVPAYIDGFWLAFAAGILALLLLALIGPPTPGPLAPASKSAKLSSPNFEKSRRLSKRCLWQLPIFRGE